MTFTVSAAGAQRQVAAFAADKQSLQEKLNQHLEASTSSTTAMHTELSTLRESAAKTEAAFTEAHNKVKIVLVFLSSNVF